MNSLVEETVSDFLHFVKHTEAEGVRTLLRNVRTISDVFDVEVKDRELSSVDEEVYLIDDHEDDEDDARKKTLTVLHTSTSR